VGVTYLPADAGPPRLAYALGRKLGPAVVRNRVRRRLRAAAHELAASPPGLAPGAYLVTVSPRAAEAPYTTLRDDLAAACAATVADRPVPGDGRS
jgi:ribonuclease P protein component